ncbi:MAG: hypothetical protein K1X94_27510 [Sandaracinaceae bacterium]|nr:hypothetical protein [Sandaracinaceae bacterium]
MILKLPLFDFATRAGPEDNQSPGEFRRRVAAVEAAIPELRGLVVPGMSFGRFLEYPILDSRPHPLQGVMWASAYNGIMLGPEIIGELLRLRLAREEDLFPVSLLPDRGDRHGHRELRVPFGSGLETPLHDLPPRCEHCGVRHPIPAFEHCLLASEIPDVPCFRLREWPNIFVIRQDLADLLQARSPEAPRLTFEPIELLSAPRPRNSRRWVLAFDVTEPRQYLAGARTSHELWHGAHLLSEARRELAQAIVDPLKRRHPSWETPSTVELKPCSPPLRRAGKPALGVEGPIVLVHGDHDYAGVARDLPKAVMRVGMGPVWQEAATHAGNLAGEILSASLKARDISQWASDWLEVRFVEGAGLPDETTREVRARWLAGEGTIAETSTTGERIRLGTSVLKSRKHGAQLPRHRVREDEDLDVLQFVRRFGESTVHFPSLARVAVQPWLEAIGEADAAALAQVAQEIATLGYTTECVGWMAPYRWDAEILFRERWPSIEAMTLSRTGRAMALPTPALSALLDGRDPDPHVGVLYASVGVDVANDDALRTWALGTFALMESASGIVASATPHEIIALLPVTTIGRAAQTLRASFEGPADALSVGVGIDRFDEPVCEMLEAARGVSSGGAAEVGIAARRERTWIREAHTSIEAFSPPSPTFRAPELTAVFETAHAALRRARR